MVSLKILNLINNKHNTEYYCLMDRYFDKWYWMEKGGTDGHCLEEFDSQEKFNTFIECVGKTNFNINHQEIENEVGLPQNILKVRDKNFYQEYSEF